MTDPLAAAVVPGTSLAMLALLVLVMGWMALSTRRRARETRALQDGLRPGDEVITPTGVLGTLHPGTGRRAALEIAPGVVVEIDRRQLLPVPQALRREGHSGTETTVAPRGADLHPSGDPRADHPTQEL